MNKIELLKEELEAAIKNRLNVHIYELCDLVFQEIEDLLTLNEGLKDAIEDLKEVNEDLEREVENMRETWSPRVSIYVD